MANPHERLLLAALEQVMMRLHPDGIRLDWKEVNYGLKLEAQRGSTKAAGTLYYSPKKRRFSWVPNGKGDKKLAQRLASTVNGVIGAPLPDIAPGKTLGKTVEIDPNSPESRWNAWIGTDEAGKGDLFGPLVVAGFVGYKDRVQGLRTLGVRDSKELTQPAIAKIAETILEQTPERVEVIAITPQRYNEMHENFTTRGGVNGILGWAHGKIAANLAARFEETEGLVVDKFGGEHRIKPYLGDAKRLEMVLRSKGESNLAVAAAAIVARHTFNKALDAMEDALGFRPHAGSSRDAQRDLLRMEPRCEEELAPFVKLHFKPVQTLLNNPKLSL